MLIDLGIRILEYLQVEFNYNRGSLYINKYQVAITIIYP